MKERKVTSEEVKQLKKDKIWDLDKTSEVLMEYIDKFRQSKIYKLYSLVFLKTKKFKSFIRSYYVIIWQKLLHTKALNKVKQKLHAM